MNHPLDGCWAKLERADQHISELKRAIIAFTETNPYRVTQNVQTMPATNQLDDFVTGQVMVTLSVSANPPPELGIYIGDALHNFHSALDHLAWQLVHRHGVVPSRLEDIEFPIFREPNGYERGVRKRLPCIPQGIKTIVDVVQPYQRRNMFSEHPLWILQQLSNFDKHRVLQTVGSVAIDNSLNIRYHQDIDIYIDKVFEPGPAVDGAPIALYYFVQNGPHPKMDVRPQLVFDIQFGAGTPLSVESKLVMPTMQEIRDYIRNDVLRPLSRFF